MSVTKEVVSAALSAAEIGPLRSVEVDAEGGVVVELIAPGDSEQQQAVGARVEQALRALDGVRAVSVRWQQALQSRQIAADDPVPGVTNVVLVMSGKGGVGKSTVAANLALALARMGQRVGLLDADIYGPSIPTMLGITGRPLSDGTKIRPLERFGIKLMSIGFLLDDPATAVVWRGPMLHGALMQFLSDVDWGKLDYLLLDLPPGTGDIALTLSQRLRTTGAVIVTTPQEVALQDVYKAVGMCAKVGISVLGVVENESWFTCTKCSERHELFGSGGGQRVAELAQAPLLGQIPIHAAVREWGDAGTPVVQAAPGSEIARSFVAVAERLVERIAAESGAATGLSIDRSGGVNRHLPISR
jgi:ATP-binding protein involved in chromosome partitioning